MSAWTLERDVNLVVHAQDRGGEGGEGKGCRRDEDANPQVTFRRPLGPKQDDAAAADAVEMAQLRAQGRNARAARG